MCVKYNLDSPKYWKLKGKVKFLQLIQSITVFKVLNSLLMI